MTVTHARTDAPAPLSPEPPAPLHDGSVAALPDAVAVPGYDRSQLEPAVVHIGVGGFHRAHQAVYFDELARAGVSTGWGITGVGLRSPQMGEVLGDQDHLYTLVVRGPEGDDVRVIGSLVRYLFAPDDPEAVLATLADPRTRLVTLTITGSAYPAGEPDPEDPDVRADVATPGTPGTAFGFLVEGLRRRRAAGLAGFTVLSCDNAQHSGDLARAAVLATARLRDVGLAGWIEEQVTFPGSMVDRITPETTPEGRDAIARRHGIDDRWPVITEPFSQWIVEDRFCAGRPPLDEVGVQFVDDVRPFEIMKTRMLNGAHSALGHLASLAGFSTTAEAMADPTIRGFVRGYLHEVARGLLQVPGVDLDAYADTLVERFSNPQISDELARLCRRSSTKVPTYVLPSVQVALDHAGPREHLVLAVAAWMRYLRGTDDDGRALEVTDALADELRALAELGGTDPHPLLGRTDLFGALAATPGFAQELEAALTGLEDGALAAAAALQRDAGVEAQESAA
ncbi:fructuronate reductase [Friedmanniella luteola]|uniref:Mannitol-1-phosphate 5-dehydrogenase n=1 Tax=Friedmanniella luteola TaxID=546871 RepID=A0A1H1NRD3_9ACTN|nr:mannitol dehydrogenase family protein [Friedmanniella luteola]SDS01518.1 fructuronate reductase [Friedmanniella luteola]